MKKYVGKMAEEGMEREKQTEKLIGRNRQRVLDKRDK
jgi:hypothetical protein